MTSLLILGGTGWLGGQVADRALASGWHVSCLARGESGQFPVGATAIVADREQPDAYGAVLDSTWDLVVELSWQPGFVNDAVRALGDRVRSWTYVSSASVYTDRATVGQDETAKLLPAHPDRIAPVEAYGNAKVACEMLTASVVGDKLRVLRPGLMVGPGDPSDRFGYWVARFAAAGSEPVLVPESAGRRAQIIDVRDLAEFVLGPSRHVVDVINTMGHSLPLTQVLDTARRVARHRGAVVAAPDELLAERAVEPWAGAYSLPLWIPMFDWTGFSAHTTGRFDGYGGTCRPLVDTLIDTLADERARGLDRLRRAGLSRDEELELLALLS